MLMKILHYRFTVCMMLELFAVIKKCQNTDKLRQISVCKRRRSVGAMIAFLWFCQILELFTGSKLLNSVLISGISFESFMLFRSELSSTYLMSYELGYSPWTVS